MSLIIILTKYFINVKIKLNLNSDITDDIGNNFNQFLDKCYITNLYSDIKTNIK